MCLAGAGVSAQNELPDYLPADGLVGWWPFNGNANDESGNGNNGTPANEPALSVDRFEEPDKSYYFDGTNYIELPSINLSYFTINAWVKTTSGQTVISKHYSATQTSSYLLYSNEIPPHCNPIIYYTDPSDQAYSTNASSSWCDGTWHMVTGTLDGINLKIYFDGALEATSPVSAETKPTDFGTLIAGGYSSSGVQTPGFTGSIDDVGMWSRALTDEEVLALYEACTTPAPTGQAVHHFPPDATLAGIEVAGENIQWYDAASGGNLLENTTQLIDGAIYYASQTIEGCESSERLAVTATVNFEPTDIALSASSIEENRPVATEIGLLSSTDPDANDSHSYALVAGEGDTGNNSFSIDGNRLLSNEALDFEAQNSYSIRISTEDLAGNILSKAFTISIEDTNDTPTDINLSNLSIEENIVGESLMGTFSTVDQDANDSFTYTLLAIYGDPENNKFRLEGDQLLATQAFDYEVNSSFGVRIRSTDSGGEVFFKTFLLSVENVNEAPSDIALSTSTVAEKLPAGTAVGNLSTTDIDAGDGHSYRLVAGAGDTDNSSFSISENQLLTAAIFDFGIKNSYAIRLETEDVGGETFSKSFTINVSKVKLSQTVIFTVPDYIYLEQSPYTLTATASSGLPVSFSIEAGNASVDGNKLTANEPGDVIIKAFQNGDENYLYNENVKTLKVRQLNSLSAMVLKPGEIPLVEGHAMLFRASGGLEQNAPVQEGTFEMSGLPEGDYILQIVPTDTGESDVFATYYEQAHQVKDALVLQINSDLAIEMTMLGKDAGNNSKGSIRGRVVEEEGVNARIVVGRRMEGVGISGVTVFLISNTTSQVVNSAVTNDNGDFAMLDVTSGNYRLELEMTGLSLDVGQGGFTFDEEMGTLEVSAIVDPEGKVALNYEIVAGIGEWEQEVLLYPVPAREKLEVIFPPTHYALLQSAQIVSVDGRILRKMMANNSSGQIELDLKSLSSGVYFLKIDYKGGVVLKRFIKN